MPVRKGLPAVRQLIVPRIYAEIPTPHAAIEHRRDFAAVRIAHGSVTLYGFPYIQLNNSY